MGVYYRLQGNEKKGRGKRRGNGRRLEIIEKETRRKKSEGNGEGGWKSKRMWIVDCMERKGKGEGGEKEKDEGRRL